MKRLVMTMLGLFVMLTLLAGPALAGGPTRRNINDDVADSPIEIDRLHHQQHGDEGGHLPATQKNVELVGKVAIHGAAAGRVADVSAFGTYAYLTVRDPDGCSDAGVAIIDIADPTTPRQVGFIEATEGSFPGEGSQILDLRSRFFTGQILVFNNEICGEGGEGGVSLWDVTKPSAPRVLAAHAGDADPGGVVSRYTQIHSAFAWQDERSKRAFVVIVDNEEATDVDILEITNPHHPVLLTELDLNAFDVLQDEGTPLGAESFLHDMIVKRIGDDYIMLLSYWDGGWVLLNVNDPATPVFLGDTDFPVVDPLTGLSPMEGNAHQAEFSHNNRFIIGTDEDFAPFRLIARITSGPSAGREFPAAQGGAAPISEHAPLTGPTHYVGRACDPATVPPAPPPFAIALIERGDCLFTVKAATVTAQGYDAAIVFNSNNAAAASPCEGVFTPGVTSTIPFVLVPRSAGFALLGIPYDPATCPGGGEPDLPAIGTPGAEVQVRAIFDGWGAVRLYDARTLRYIASYAIAEALKPRYATGYGDLSVHEVATDPNQNLAYLSYYAGGLRVIRFGPQGIEEVGRYIAEGGNNFWGVEVHQLPRRTHEAEEDEAGRRRRTLILASDIDSGLWIFRYTGGP